MDITPVFQQPPLECLAECLPALQRIALQPGVQHRAAESPLTPRTQPRTLKIVHQSSPMPLACTSLSQHGFTQKCLARRQPLPVREITPESCHRRSYPDLRNPGDRQNPPLPERIEKKPESTNAPTFRENNQSRKITSTILSRSLDGWKCDFAASGPMIVRKPFLNLHQTTLDCENRRFGARFHAELCKDVANMRFDGEFVCNKDAGDILVGKSAGDERQDF